MDPSDEQHDDDLFADLYGDDEPPKPFPEPAKQAPVETASIAAIKESTVNISLTAIPEPPAAPVPAPGPSKAVDPRAPQPPTQPQPVDETSLEEQQQQQQQQHYTAIETHDYSSWDASNMSQGQGGNEGHGGYEQIGANGYGEQGTGSPAIKEDGKMFIGGLNWETTDDSLKEYFSQFGEVTECTVMRDGPTGRSRGFGFLTFKDPKTVNIVMVKEHYLDGKIIDPKRAIPRDEQEKTSKIFVGGVSQEATESDFREYFMQFGRVLDATLMMDKDTGRPRGFGFVTFDSESAVENALNCPTLEIMGKQIEVKKAQPRGNTRGTHMDEREDRGGFRDRGNRDRFDNREANGNGGYSGGLQGQNGLQGPQSAAYNGMTPQMMAQYWQQMQRYMQAMSQFGRGGGGPVPIINPAMMQQAMQSMPQMAGMNPQMIQQMNMQAQAQMMRQQQQQQGGHQQSPAVQSPPQMPIPIAQQGPYGGQGAHGYAQGYEAQQGGYDMSQQQQQQGPHNAYRQSRFQNHPSQRDYQPPQSHPSSWEGMYDDVPPQQVVQQVQQQNAAAAQQSRGGTPNGQFGRFEGPPPNAPTGPRNTKPGSNYRGGRGGAVVGRGAGYNTSHRGGFHPYARNQERFA